jgi:hypothetical protein
MGEKYTVSNDIKSVGNFLMGILPPVELDKIIKASPIFPESRVVINIKLTLYELNMMKMGYLPDNRNCLEIGK